MRLFNGSVGGPLAAGKPTAGRTVEMLAAATCPALVRGTDPSPCTSPVLVPISAVKRRLQRRGVCSRAAAVARLGGQRGCRGRRDGLPVPGRRSAGIDTTTVVVSAAKRGRSRRPASARGDRQDGTMKPIVTLTLNPAIDGAAGAETVRPIRKVRTWNERYDPGGGGINAARVIRELGGPAMAVYLSGGTTGPVLDGLVRSSGIESVRIPIAGHTRISHTVHERSSGLEFRFVPEGPAVTSEEWSACLAALEAVDCD